MTVFRFATGAALTGLLTSVAVKSAAAQYEVEGRIDQTVYKMDGTVQSETKSEFTVFVNDCSWLIQETNLDADEHLLGVSETAGVNSGLIYSFAVSIGQNNLAAGRFGGRASGVSRASGVIMANIYSNNVPVSETDGDCACHLWLMFASGCPLKSLSTNWLTPVYDVNASASANRLLKRRASWELAGGLGSLPTNVTYFESGAESLIDATYIATGVTNVGGLKIPSGFIFEQRIGIMYAPGPILPGDTTPAYHVRKRAVATVTAVRPYCSRKQFLPTATGVTQVRDERLAGVPNSNPSMTYILRDGVRWVSITEAKRLSEVAATRPVQQKPLPKKIVAIILLAPAVVVFGLWLLSRSKKQTLVVDPAGPDGNPQTVPTADHPTTPIESANRR